MSDEPRYVPLDDMSSEEGDEPRPPVRSPKSSRAPAKSTKLPSSAKPEPPAERKLEAPRRCRLMIPFPPQLIERIKTLREEVEITGEPPLELVLGAFLIPDDARRAELQTAIRKAPLPLTLRLARVHAEVRGQQTYIAAWQLDDPDRLRQLRTNLIDQLTSLLIDESPFEPMIVVGEGIPAQQFPPLIAAMQHSFDPLTWRVEKIEATET